MSYAPIDTAIKQWAKKHNLTLFDKFAGREERFVYLSNSCGDTIQIYLKSLKNGRYGLHAVPVESSGTDQFNHKIEVGVSDISDGLEIITTKVRHYLSDRECE